MPIYEYICPKCKEEAEVIQNFNDPPIECDKCGDEMERQMSLSSFALKGSGWYETEYGKRSKINGTDKLPTSERTTKPNRKT